MEDFVYFEVNGYQYRTSVSAELKAEGKDGDKWNRTHSARILAAARLALKEVPAQAEQLAEVPMISGTLITREKDTIFVPLPRALWREIDGGCACSYCSSDGKSASPAYWDTLALGKNATKGKPDYTYTVHYPEINGARKKAGRA
jgi:hypothetical protein